MKKAPPENLRLPGLEDHPQPMLAPKADLERAAQETRRSHRAAIHDEERTEGQPHNRRHLPNPHD